MSETSNNGSGLPAGGKNATPCPDCPKSGICQTCHTLYISKPPRFLQVTDLEKMNDLLWRVGNAVTVKDLLDAKDAVRAFMVNR